MSLPRARCPTCRREIEWSENSPLRPFCSERCKLIDLGGWLSEQRRIAGEAQEKSGTFPDFLDDQTKTS
jgi:endogenous inhibitor of DNA gyrase (YacG/DUF329 family)